jgi:hypothetical protein
MHTILSLQNLYRRDNLEDLDIDNITLKLILEKWIVKM